MSSHSCVYAHMPGHTHQQGLVKGLEVDVVLAAAAVQLQPVGVQADAVVCSNTHTYRSTARVVILFEAAQQQPYAFADLKPCRKGTMRAPGLVRNLAMTL